MKLYIGNLNNQTGEKGLRDLFATAGELVSVKIIIDRDSGRSRGFGFVEYETNQMGNSAISKFNGYDLDGFQLVVNEAKERQSQGPGRRNSW